MAVHNKMHWVEMVEMVASADSELLRRWHQTQSPHLLHLSVGQAWLVLQHDLSEMHKW